MDSIHDIFKKLSLNMYPTIIRAEYALFKGQINKKDRVKVVFMYKKLEKINNDDIIKQFYVKTEELVNFGNQVLDYVTFLDTMSAYKKDLLGDISTVIILNRPKISFNNSPIDYYDEDCNGDYIDTIYI